MGSLGGGPMQAFTYLSGARVPDASAGFCFPSLTPSTVRMLGKGTLMLSSFPRERLCVLGLSSAMEAHSTSSSPPKRHDFLKEQIFPLVSLEYPFSPLARREGQ